MNNRNAFRFGTEFEMISIVAPLDYERYAVLVSPALAPVTPHVAGARAARSVEPLQPAIGARDALGDGARSALSGADQRPPTRADRQTIAGPQPDPVPVSIADVALPVSLFLTARAAPVAAHEAAVRYQQQDVVKGTLIHVSG